MRLTMAQRKRIPKAEYGVPQKAPGHGSYPMNDKAHAANAKARATQMVNAGKLSPSMASQIRAKANRILGQ